MTYVFYDTETTGTDTAFDQVLQFAAIRTDDELNETARFEIRCRLLPHIVPAPEAIQVTGIAPERLEAPALPSHYEMACAIHKRLTDWSPAIFLGWNSIHFDEHLLRQVFYQNLLPPYLTNTQGNGRADMLHITRAVCSLSPGLLTVPTDADGQPRYALDRIAPANGHVHADAHDALADASATLHMARLIINGAPSLWHSFTQLATKKAATRFVHTEPVFHLFRRAGGMAWTSVTPIGVNPDNQAEIRLYDLDTDPADLAKLSHDELAARTAGSNPPLTRLKTNQSPIALTPDQAANAGLAAPESLELLRDRVDRLCNERELRERLLAALPPKQPADTTHVEQQIYDGFPGATDESTMRRFHTVPWDRRLALVSTFRDSRLRHLGNRLLFLERPDLLSPAYRKTCRDAVHRRLTATADTPWRTVPAAIADIDRLLRVIPETADTRSDLERLRVFLSRRIRRTSLATAVLDRLRKLISRRVPRTAAAIVTPLLSALPLADAHGQRQPTPVATAFNVAIEDEDMLARGFSVPLQGTTSRIGLYVQCLRKTGTIQAVLAFGAFPRNKPVQAAVRRPDRTVERFGPVVTATPAHGFHSPRITARIDVFRLIDAAFRSGSLISNGHNSVWNRIPEAANRDTAAELKRCSRSPTGR